MPYFTPPYTVAMLFIDIISLFINWANKDACLLARQVSLWIGVFTVYIGHK